MDVSNPSWMTAFHEREDLAPFRSAGLALFAMALKFGYDDLETIGADAVVDGPDDKGCDVVYIDPEQKIAIVAQSYIASTLRQAASDNKAASLRQAMSYLIEVDAESVPERLTASASSLRQALADGDVDRIYVWFVHNCPGSENVRRELHAVEQTVHSIVANRFKNSTLSVIAEEISAATLEKLYTDTNTPILVNDVVEFKADSVLDFSSSDWSCYVLPLPATLLRDLYERHKTDLFSANVRDFLGMKAGDSNINYQMQKSLRERPQNFFVYNNGLTILTHRIEVNREAPPGISVAVHGMSIVNGAQTTGTIGTSQEAPATLM